MIEIPVKDHHIDDGVEGSDTECPIALAIGDSLGHSASVGNTIVRIDVFKTQHVPHIYLLTPKLQEWICAFDKGCSESLGIDEFSVILDTKTRGTSEIGTLRFRSR